MESKQFLQILLTEYFCILNPISLLVTLDLRGFLHYQVTVQYQEGILHSIQFWQYLLGVCIRSHRLGVESHKIASPHTLDVNYKFGLLPMVGPTSYKWEVPISSPSGLIDRMAYRTQRTHLLTVKRLPGLLQSIKINDSQMKKPHRAELSGLVQEPHLPNTSKYSATTKLSEPHSSEIFMETSTCRNNCYKLIIVTS